MTDHTEESPTETVFRPRRPWLAALLSLLFTGAGQIYNGQWKKGIGFYVTEAVFAAVMFLFWDDFVSMLLCVSILVGYNLFVAGEAYATARGLREYTPKPCNRWWVYGLIVAVSVVSGVIMDVVVKDSYFKTYKAPSGSMIPTLLVGDHFMVEMLDDADVIERGDVVIFDYPEDETKHFVKRVVALPGDTIEVRNKTVHIVGVPLDEDYVQHTQADTMPVRDNFGPYTVPGGMYFVMGDNREASHDSRFFGAVKRDAITGRARYIYFPGDIGSEGWAERLGRRLD